jgi:hypothetical protein
MMIVNSLKFVLQINHAASTPYEGSGRRGGDN